MNQNPYQPPAAYAPSAAAAGGNRGAFVLAAIGAWFAGVYWAAITLLIVLGMAMGSGSGLQLVLPCVLIGLYAVRGYQIFNGDPNAARRIIWLHGVGCIAAVLQVMQGHGFLVMLQGFKVVVHIFGGIAAYVALKGYAGSYRRA
jgi:hypothetical protein